MPYVAFKMVPYEIHPAGLTPANFFFLEQILDVII